LINFAGQSIPLAYLKITLQKNALGADRYIVMKSVDDFSTRPVQRNAITVLEVRVFLGLDSPNKYSRDRIDILVSH
jgi:hypothetical protein